MGDILDNIGAAASGNPYTGSGTNDIQASGDQSTIMGTPAILKHSHDRNQVISDPLSLNENGSLAEVYRNNDLL